MTTGGTSGYAARWGDLESKFYSFLAQHERIGETAQQHIFAGYAEQFIAGQKVLDVGSGFGDFLDLLKDRGVIGFGVDVDQGMIRESRARGHTVFVSDALTFLRATRRRFDGVFMGNFVEHFSSEDVLALVKGAYRVLRPGGKVVVATPDPRSMHVHLHEFWRDATHVRLYDRDLLTFMMDVSGFQIVAIGSNDATAYNPGVEWFGVSFADQLTALNDRFVPSTNRMTKRDSEVVQTPATSHGGDPATADHIDLRVARLSQTLERTRQEIGHTIDVLRVELSALRAAMDAQDGSGQSRSDTQPPSTDLDVPDILDRERVAEHEDGLIPPMPIPIIGERRSAAALRRWRGDATASGYATFPPPDRRPALSMRNGTMPSVTLALLRDVLDEARLCAAALIDHETTIANLDARLQGLSAVVALTQQEMVQGGRAVRQRLHGINQGMEDVHRALAEEAGRIDEALPRLASESQARVAMMQAMREQMASVFSHLYPPREYYVVGVRETEDIGRGAALPQ